MMEVITKQTRIEKCLGTARTLTLLLLTFSYQCENPTTTVFNEDRRVTIVRQECANASTNLNNLFAVCGAGSVDDPFRIVHEVQLMHLSNPANEAAAWSATACNGGQCYFRLIDDLNMDGMSLTGPIGISAANAFHANFDGNGKTISKLTINFPADDDVGLFGYIGNGVEINNVSLIDANINGDERVGGLVGTNDAGNSIESSYSTGSVSGDSDVGGFVGDNSGTINGANSFVDTDGGANGLGSGTCAPGTCLLDTLAFLRDNYDEGGIPLSWDSTIWGAFGVSGSFPCLRNMPAGARSCP